MKKISPAFPVLLSTRLQLRPFTVDDCAEVNRLVGDKDVATPLIAVDYPTLKTKRGAGLSNTRRVMTPEGL